MQASKATGEFHYIILLLALYWLQVPWMIISHAAVYPPNNYRHLTFKDLRVLCEKYGKTTEANSPLTILSMVQTGTIIFTTMFKYEPCLNLELPPLFPSRVCPLWE